MGTNISLRLEEGQREHYDLSVMLPRAEQEGFSLREPLSVSVDVSREDYGIEARIHVTGVVLLLCSRCLTEFELPVKLKHRIIILGKEDGWELDDETLDMQVVDLDNGELRVGELVRQLVLESLPIKPLCDAGCRGLCSVCGCNLNERECDCQTRQIDPRLAKLKEFVVTTKEEV